MKKEVYNDFHSLEDLFKMAEDIKHGWCMAAMTDSYIFEPYQKDISQRIEEDKLIEIRIFDSEKEYRGIRRTVGDVLFMRISDDDSEMYDEEQYIDDRYTEQNHKRLVVRYYLYDVNRYPEKYKQTASARVADWRLAGVR